MICKADDLNNFDTYFAQTENMVKKIYLKYLIK